MPLSRVTSLLKSHFLAGLFVLIPLAVISWLLLGALDALWGLKKLLPLAWQPESFLEDPALVILFNVIFTLGGAVILAFAVSMLGWASKQYLGQKMLEGISDLIQRIPVIRSIYGALDQLLKTLAASGGSQFSRVVYVEYPRKGVWALAFVTGPARARGIPPGHLNVYVPTTPNPTSGFHLLVPEAEVKDSHLKVEDAFKTILSLGIAQPDT
jgi:uncharacterized membrane protein